ncbi:MAG: hypothetical protein IKM15_05095 [Peptococcaceae bacterium]|nr:hypothetical protein [Peptococcaceae bacterium]
MNSELITFQQKLDCFLQDFQQLLYEFARLRQVSPRLRTESSKLLEQYLLRGGRMVKQISHEYHDDLMQGISWLKIKMML